MYFAHVLQLALFLISFSGKKNRVPCPPWKPPPSKSVLWVSSKLIRELQTQRCTLGQTWFSSRLPLFICLKERRLQTFIGQVWVPLQCSSSLLSCTPFQYPNGNSHFPAPKSISRALFAFVLCCVLGSPISLIILRRDGDFAFLTKMRFWLKLHWGTSSSSFHPMCSVPFWVQKSLSLVPS